MPAKSISFEARRRFELWAEQYDRQYGSDNSPLTYTLRAELPIELDAALDLVVVEVDVMQHEFFGASGWQRALFLDRDGHASDDETCDLQVDAEGCTVHRYCNGDLLRITAAGIISNATGQMMLAPMLKRFDRHGRKLWASKRVDGALTNRARDVELFDLERTLPVIPVWGIAARGDKLILETDAEIAVFDATTGKRARLAPRSMTAAFPSTLALAFVAIAGCAATTGDSAYDDQPSAGGTRASSIGYDNTLSGLLATTVQSAVDDIAIAGAANAERLDVIETKLAARDDAAARVIVCRYSAASHALLLGQNEVTHTFTAAECGGTLPTAGHVGALSRVRTCGSSFEWIVVSNAGEPGGPGITFYRDDDSFCIGAANLAAVFSRTN